MTKKKNKEYDVFISGELIDLCAVNEDEIKNGRWVSWFNNIKGLQNSMHGVFPNNKKIQKQIYEKFLTNEDLGLFITTKQGDLVGIISINNIDRHSGVGFWGLLISEPGKLPNLNFATLEAVALITNHAFKEMGLQRIAGGQNYPELKGWNRMLECIGFISEGYERYALKRGHHYKDLIKISITYEIYQSIIKKRGSLWSGLKSMKEIYRSLPKKSFAEKIIETWENEKKIHFKGIF